MVGENAWETQLIDAARHPEQLPHGLMGRSHAVQIAHFGRFSGTEHLDGNGLVLILFTAVILPQILAKLVGYDCNPKRIATADDVPRMWGKADQDQRTYTGRALT